jgi:hypothetical protein
VIRVPVREAHGFDGREPDAEPTRVLHSVDDLGADAMKADASYASAGCGGLLDQGVQLAIQSDCNVRDNLVAELAE